MDRYKKHEENAEFENEQIEVPGLVGNVAVARVWRTSWIGHVIKHEEKAAFANGVSVGMRKGILDYEYEYEYRILRIPKDV